MYNLSLMPGGGAGIVNSIREWETNMCKTRLLSICVAAILIPAVILAQQPAGGMSAVDFKITVLAGEDGVNIIKKKTAVKPVVQVKDKNDLPIAGVAVVIGLGATGAFAGGSNTATVVTNANGIATAPDFRPTTQGQVTIRVSATYQGQTQTAIIHQTNFQTVAQALKAGKTPGPSQSGNASQANNASQATDSSAAAQAATAAAATGASTAGAAAAGGGHGLLIAVAAVAVVGAAAGVAYKEGLFGNSSSTNSCSQSVANNLVNAVNALDSCVQSTQVLTNCSSQGTTYANALAAFCVACGVTNIDQYVSGSVQAEVQTLQLLGASAASISAFSSSCGQ